MSVVQDGIDAKLSPIKMMDSLKLPKYEAWGLYEKWLPMNILRICIYGSMGV